jgi:hypothetical protein
MPKKKKDKDKKSKVKPKLKPKKFVVKPRQIKHRSYLKKMILTDESKPTGVRENPFIVKNRSISHRVNSIIIGIQQPIVQLLGLNADTWYKQYCDPASKTIFLEVYDKNGK